MPDEHAKPRAGLLPLYLKLYDDTMPERRAELEAFLDGIERKLAGEGIDVVTAPVCRVKDEFDGAVADLEKKDVDIIVTLHLAYSPSLESADALANARVPILVLDTTRDFDFGMDVDPALIMYNHGIHGVQDMASILRRRGRPYEIVAGHHEASDVVARAADIVRAAHAARRFNSMKTLRIGESFAGMGDFAVDQKVLAGKLGIAVTQIDAAALAGPASEVPDDAIEKEMAENLEVFDADLAEDVHRRSVRLGLGLRAALEEGGYGAFSVNFLAFDSPDEPVSTVPFLEISKAMARGVGYAGEGDVLTASLVGALLAGWQRTTFTEIFCPDWRGDALFLSHMGEINPRVAAGTPLLQEKDFPFTNALNPASITCAPAPGPATYVNLAPGPDDTFSLIIAPVEILGDGTHPEMKKSVRGWMKPGMPVAAFLEECSRLGGTHHSALVLGNHVEALSAFARFTGLTPVGVR